jgi:hypothetical protein
MVRLLRSTAATVGAGRRRETMTAREREIVRALRAFAGERFPVGVTLPLAVGVCIGPYAVAGGDWTRFLRVAGTAFLGLFVLRIVDDIRSVDEDRTAHPNRALPAGRIAVPPLVGGAYALGAVAVLLSAGWLTVGLASLVLWYAAYFLCAAHIPVVVRPVLVNVVFLAIPLWMDVSQGRLPSNWLIVLGLFFWLSAIGHDYAHSVHAPSESHTRLPSCSDVVGGRNAAVIGLGFYVGAYVAGVWFAGGQIVGGQRFVLFLGGVTLLFALVVRRLARLIAHPCLARARRLYVSGFIFFLIPSCLLGIDRLLDL